MFSNSQAFAALKSDGSTMGRFGWFQCTDRYWICQCIFYLLCICCIEVKRIDHSMGIFIIWWFQCTDRYWICQCVFQFPSICCIEVRRIDTAWGHPDYTSSSYGGSNAPTDTGYVNVFSNNYAFAAIKSDGSTHGDIRIWCSTH